MIDKKLTSKLYTIILNEYENIVKKLGCLGRIVERIIATHYSVIYTI